jgi:aminopeptidase YwaD
MTTKLVHGFRPVLLAAIAPLALWAASITPQSYLDHIKFLASDNLKGRATGSPELERAADYIAGQFKAAGLKPAGGNGYRQPFQVITDAKMGPANHLQVSENGRKTELKPGSGYVPFSFSSSGQGSAGVVFAGYGITAGEFNYDDYANLDVKDKFVLIMRHEPQENDEHSPFEGKELTKHATFVLKAVNAKMHGARGVILINDNGAHKETKDELDKFGRATGPTDAGIFFIQMRTATAEEWLKAEGHDLKQIVADIDKNLAPESFPLTKVSVDLEVDIRHERKTVNNVVGYLPGQTSEFVIIGAHYDHLGLGDEHSLAQSQVGQVHHGADDNASGTAGVIELAKWFATQPQPKRGILFMTFAGEEIGLLGSSYFAEHPTMPIDKAVAMLNMDMIGRIRDGKIYVNGTGTGSTLARIVNGAQVPPQLKIDLGESAGYGGSDHMSFTPKQVPVIFFFSGLHGDYHKPSDTWDKIDATGAAALLSYVGDIATRIANDPERPQFQKVPERARPISGGSGSGYGPNFGSVPDFNEPPKGVRFADIREGSPAAKAGLKPGDILISFDGKDIGNLYDFTYALQAHKPGDNVPVTVLRGSQTIEAKVLLTERR